MDWLRQTKEPLFPDVLWSRPENKRHAGKLLIIGGHKQTFNAVSEAYSATLKAGIGIVRVILPDSLHKMLHAVFPDAEFASSTPVGSFSRLALDDLVLASEWADGVLLAGDFGHNSETAILL
jgi:NAD(P)H-hydrate repair Nnr-like enzyme with NAD(P)H-hydrate dehydratase domain